MLPTLTIPEYLTPLPSNKKKKIKYRPFLTGEKKVLLIAKDTGDSEQIENAIYNIIKTCTFGELDLNKVPFFDVEWIFIKIIEKSIGETIPLSVVCKSCGKENDYELDLTKTELSSKIDSGKIILSDNLGITIRYPSSMQIKAIRENNSPQVIFDMIVDCIDTIFTDKTVYQSKDSSREEMVSWIDQLTDEQFEKIEAFMLNFPYLRNKIEFTCRHCGTPNKYDVDGLEDFFL